jgi:hypothetical protein
MFFLNYMKRLILKTENYIVMNYDQSPESLPIVI